VTPVSTYLTYLTYQYLDLHLPFFTHIITNSSWKTSSVMDPTTLVTFLFRAPPSVRTVELLGSWDNFQIPYRMHHDRLRGPTFFSGCFRMENIIFDGCELQWSKPRSGGLKQGGTYWYYYRLNYHHDACDDRHPTTTTCPLMPGQQLNVMEVPIEVTEPPTRSHSICGYDVSATLDNITLHDDLDPANKFVAVQPPPISKVHSRCHSDVALDGRLEGRTPSIVKATASPDSPRKPPSRRSVSPCTVRSEGALHQGVFSGPSSVYSQPSSRGDPVSPMSRVSEASLPAVKRDPIHADRDGDHGEEEDLFSYPEVFGAVPFASLKATGATLFTSYQGQEEPVSYDSDSDYSPDVDYDSDPEDRAQVEPSISLYGVRQDWPASTLASQHSLCQPQTIVAPDAGLGSGDESGNFPLVSPTFSDSTVESSEGHRTPDRLSTHSWNEHNFYIASEYDDAGFDFGFDDPIEHASSSSREPSAAGGDRPDHHGTTLALLRSPFSLNYSLPSISTASSRSRVKTSSRPSARPSLSQQQAAPMLPSITPDALSMADAILDEFSFLGAEIH
jgi:hypothetical protein